MVIKRNSFLKKGIALLFCGLSTIGFCQSNTEKQITTVFNQLVSTYGSAKTAPQLEIVFDKPKKIKPAEYLISSTSNPTIRIDAYLYTICRTFEKDSLNALSIVLSHELAHYYGDHTFCSDYAYAIKDKNKSLAIDIRNSSLNSRIEKETEADQKSFFYSAAAGYAPFGLQSILIDKIYKEYQLPDVQKGYPSKQERIDIAKNAEEKAKQLYAYFQSGLKAMEEKQYDEAITAFTNANGFIPFRENFNNIGVAKALKALNLKVLTKEEVDFPKRFQYPFEVDNTSRLQKEQTRALDDDSDAMSDLLQTAKKAFEEAIRLDPSYTMGYTNLACVYDLLGNPEAAIGKVKELPINTQKELDAQRILAIAYYHADNEKKAEEIWENLKM